MIRKCGVSYKHKHHYLRDLHIPTVAIRLDGGVKEYTHGHLGVRRLAAQLLVGVSQTLTHRVYANKSSSGQEVLALQAAGAHGILLCPSGVAVLGQELTRGQLVTGVAAVRTGRRAKVCRAGDILQVGEALLGLLFLICEAGRLRGLRRPVCERSLISNRHFF